MDDRKHVSVIEVFMCLEFYGVFMEFLLAFMASDELGLEFYI